MMMSEPLITIGITAYNAQETIERAVRSAAAQDWPSTEILVVDDASTDGTCAAIESQQKDMPNVKLLRHEKNKGVAAARNTIIENAAGEFVTFFDDDDESTPDRLTRQYKRLKDYERDFANGAPVICHTARRQIYPDGQERIEPTMGCHEEEAAPHGQAVAQRILFGKSSGGDFGAMATCSQMARTRTYRDLGGFDASFRRSEDTDLNVRLALAGGHFVGIADPLVIQTMTMSNDKSLKDEEIFTLKLLEKHRDFIASKTCYPACRAWIRAKYTLLGGNKKAFAAKLLSLCLRHPVFVFQRISRALPNLGFNIVFSRFYHGKK